MQSQNCLEAQAIKVTQPNCRLMQMRSEVADNASGTAKSVVRPSLIMKLTAAQEMCVCLKTRRGPLKPFKFLIPVGIAAAALIGGKATAEVKRQPVVPVVEQRTSDQQNIHENTLLMKLSDQTILSASHRSHSSHASHSSHSSHRSGA
jgi:hypothetical protein